MDLPLATIDLFATFGGQEEEDEEDEDEEKSHSSHLSSLVALSLAQVQPRVRKDHARSLVERILPSSLSPSPSLSF